MRAFLPRISAIAINLVMSAARVAGCASLEAFVKGNAYFSTLPLDVGVICKVTGLGGVITSQDMSAARYNAPKAA